MELIANVDQWVEEITKVNDGDDRDAENHNISIEGLADRTFHTYTHCLLDTTAKPTGNVGTFDFGTSSTILFKGSVTFTPTSSVLFSFGGSVAFSSAPSFLFGLNATSGTVTISTTANLSGTTTLSGTTNLSGVTTIVGSSNRLKLTARDVERKVSLAYGNPDAIYSDGPGGWIDVVTPMYLAPSDTVRFQIPASSSDIQNYSVPLQLKNGATLKSVRVVWNGDGQLDIHVRRNGTSVGSVIDASTGTVTISPNITVNLQTQSFVVEFSVQKKTTNETVNITAMFVTQTISEYDEG